MSLIKLFRIRTNKALALIFLLFAASIVATIPTVVLTLQNPDFEHDYYASFILPQLLLPIICAAAIIPFGLGVIKVPARRIFPTKRVPLTDVILALGIFSGATTVAGYVTNFLVSLVESTGFPVPSYDDLFSTPQDLPQLLAYIFVLAVLPPICEELIYRGVILHSLSPLNKGVAVFVSAVAFGLMHGTVQQIPYAFLIGLVLGWLSIRFDSIILPILLHMFNNAISCVSTALSMYCTENTSTAFDYSYTIVSILALIGCAIIFAIKHKNDEKTENTLDNGSAIKAVLSAPVFWVFIVIFIGYTLYTNYAMLILGA